MTGFDAIAWGPAGETAAVVLPCFAAGVVVSRGAAANHRACARRGIGGAAPSAGWRSVQDASRRAHRPWPAALLRELDHRGWRGKTDAHRRGQAARRSVAAARRIAIVQPRVRSGRELVRRLSQPAERGRGRRRRRRVECLRRSGAIRLRHLRSAGRACDAWQRRRSDATGFARDRGERAFDAKPVRRRLCRNARAPDDRGPPADPGCDRAGAVEAAGVKGRLVRHAREARRWQLDHHRRRRFAGAEPALRDAGHSPAARDSAVASIRYRRVAARVHEHRVQPASRHSDDRALRPGHRSRSRRRGQRNDQRRCHRRHVLPGDTACPGPGDPAGSGGRASHRGRREAVQRYSVHALPRALVAARSSRVDVFRAWPLQSVRQSSPR